MCFPVPRGCSLGRGAAAPTRQSKGEEPAISSRKSLSLKAKSKAVEANLLDEERDAAGPLAHPFDDVPWQFTTGREFTNHLGDLHAIKRRQRYHAMVRPDAPLGAEPPAAQSR